MSQASTNKDPHGTPHHRCAISGNEHPRRNLVSIETIRAPLLERMRADHPQLAEGGFVSRQELDRYRELYVADLLKAEFGELGELEKKVALSITNNETIAQNVEESFGARTLGERLSDGLASFGGSWIFLISFGVILVTWIALNIVVQARAFDPYPFILLNLILSCLAAVQAPIIMMSQTRQEAKDRLRSRNDYQVNLKAELEIRQLHEKLDHLITRQWQRLAEIQQIQLEMLQEARNRR